MSKLSTGAWLLAGALLAGCASTKEQSDNDLIALHNGLGSDATNGVEIVDIDATSNIYKKPELEVVSSECFRRDLLARKDIEAVPNHSGDETSDLKIAPSYASQFRLVEAVEVSKIPCISEEFVQELMEDIVLSNLEFGILESCLQKDDCTHALRAGIKDGSIQLGSPESLIP
ncbi:MAG: hypothetical protein R3E13_03050 [Alphaproteobacteria bacterium]